MSLQSELHLNLNFEKKSIPKLTFASRQLNSSQSRQHFPEKISSTNDFSYQNSEDSDSVITDSRLLSTKPDESNDLAYNFLEPMNQNPTTQRFQTIYEESQYISDDVEDNMRRKTSIQSSEISFSNKFTENIFNPLSSITKNNTHNYIQTRMANDSSPKNASTIRLQTPTRQIPQNEYEFTPRNDEMIHNTQRQIGLNNTTSKIGSYIQSTNYNNDRGGAPQFILSHRGSLNQTRAPNKSISPMRQAPVSHKREKTMVMNTALTTSRSVNLANLTSSSNNRSRSSNVNYNNLFGVEVKEKLRTIFQYYTSFGDKNNSKFLKTQRFQKLMNDAEIRDTNLTQKKLDLLFIAENKQNLNMEYEPFLGLLVKIARIKYKHLQLDKDALQMLIDTNFIPLYSQIIQTSNFNLDYEKVEIDENIIIVLKHASNMLYKLYCNYFSWELTNTNTIINSAFKQKTENSIYLYLKDFDIIPTLISKNTAAITLAEIKNLKSTRIISLLKMSLWFENINNDIDAGVFFTFSKFVYLLMRISLLTTSQQFDLPSQPLNNFEKLCLFLEKMGLSVGITNFSKANFQISSSNTSGRSSIIISKDVTKVHMIRLIPPFNTVF